MITRSDDYAIHQTALPINEPSQSDRNFYDRYFFSGFDDTGDYMFGIGFGVYPNRRVMDGHFSIAMGNRQVCFHSSRRAPKDRTDTTIGPFCIQVETPLERLRVKLAPNEHDIECDLLFTANSLPNQEPPSLMHDDGHLIMHTTRFTQMGRWRGWLSIDGVKKHIDQAFAVRDRSWGIRPVGEPQGGAPGLMSGEPGVYWLWNPMHWSNTCTHMGTYEDRDGRPTQISADSLPIYTLPEQIPPLVDPGRVAMRGVTHTLTYEKGTRYPASAAFKLTAPDGVETEYRLQTKQKFLTKGIGYNHSSWGHGMWKGELVTEREEINLDEINPLDYPNIHIQQVAIGTQKDDSGCGILESLTIGRHARSGFKDFFDGAE